MDIVRNFINISGIADENDLPNKINGQVIQYSEADTIYIPENQPEIQSIFQIIIDIKITGSRKIQTPVGYSLVLDGIKKLKIIYTDTEGTGKANFIDIVIPYNTFVEASDNINLGNVSVYVIDAYFDILDKRRIYSSMLYLINVLSPSSSSEKYANNCNNANLTEGMKKISGLNNLQVFIDENNKEPDNILVDLDEECLWGNILWKYVLTDCV